MAERRLCGYSGLGLVGDLSGLPTTPEFPARCSCGASVTVTYGRISEHYVWTPEDEPEPPTDHASS